MIKDIVNNKTTNKTEWGFLKDDLNKIKDSSRIEQQQEANKEKTISEYEWSSLK